MKKRRDAKRTKHFDETAFVIFVAFESS